jgi:hypothetical protein
MTQMSYREALDALSTRNAGWASIYKESAKSLLSRSVSSLAASMADQRRELGRELAALALILPFDDAPLEIEMDLPAPPSPPIGAEEAIPALLGRMQKAEAEDYELLSALSGAVLPRSVDAAERLAALAEQARKRASWAQDHLDLLGIS